MHAGHLAVTAATSGFAIDGILGVGLRLQATLGPATEDGFEQLRRKAMERAGER